MPAAVDMMIRVSHLLVCFNSSANFVVYYLNGEKFREEWLPRMDCAVQKLSDGIGGKRKMLNTSSHPGVGTNRQIATSAPFAGMRIHIMYARVRPPVQTVDDLALRPCL